MGGVILIFLFFRISVIQTNFLGVFAFSVSYDAYAIATTLKQLVLSSINFVHCGL